MGRWAGSSAHLLTYSSAPLLPRTSAVSQPWRCLCLGMRQITRTTPLLRTILQSTHRFLTEACTFIPISFRIVD